MRDKILIASYSLQGNTKRVAECIQELCGGDFYEIAPMKPYSVASAYLAGMIHTRTGHLPQLKERIDLEEYKTIFIGTPIWAYTLAPPVRSFISEHSFAGKNVVLFCTHAGAAGNYFDKAKELCQGATFLEGRDFSHVSKMSKESLMEDVGKWLKSIGLNK